MRYLEVDGWIVTDGILYLLSSVLFVLLIWVLGKWLVSLVEESVQLMDCVTGGEGKAANNGKSGTKWSFRSMSSISRSIG